MRPRDTVYRLATSPRDYARCHALMRAQGPDVGLTFPTVFAERGTQVVGLLGTRPSDKAVIAGPMVLSPDVSRANILAMRLGEAYEEVLRRAGVTVYHLHVASGQRAWADILARAGFEPWQNAEDGGTWYQRRLAA